MFQGPWRAAVFDLPDVRPNLQGNATAIMQNERAQSRSAFTGSLRRVLGRTWTPARRHHIFITRYRERG